MNPLGTFRDRKEAGRLLGKKLEYLREDEPVVVGLPRGGVIVAAEVAATLQAPLDVLAVRKLTMPTNPELGLGAIAGHSVMVIDEELANRVGYSKEEVQAVAEMESEELIRRENAYRSGKPIDLADRTVIIVDDGLATGVTALAAVRAIRARHPKKVVLAAPVCSVQAKQMLEGEADEVVCGIAPGHLTAVGAWYEDFTQAEDEDVIAALAARVEG